MKTMVGGSANGNNVVWLPLDPVHVTSGSRVFMDVGVTPRKFSIVFRWERTVFLLHCHSTSVRRVGTVQGLRYDLAAFDAVPNYTAA